MHRPATTGGPGQECGVDIVVVFQRANLSPLLKACGVFSEKLIGFTRLPSLRMTGEDL